MHLEAPANMLRVLLLLSTARGLPFKSLGDWGQGTEKVVGLVAMLRARPRNLASAPIAAAAVLPGD